MTPKVENESDVRRNFINRNRESIVCEPSGRSYEQLKYDRIDPNNENHRIEN
jgi:hypothetical protein